LYTAYPDQAGDFDQQNMEHENEGTKKVHLIKDGLFLFLRI